MAGQHRTKKLTEAAKAGYPNGKRGFAAMRTDQVREIASRGGRAAHESGTGHEWTSDEARRAGRLGGIASRGGRGRILEEEGVG